ncbi:valine--tRNA ligase, partial [Candidatus Kaiserbacteria bacterium]|nr:valine--tRNA ligase [Candidatus Kaiserbacteria bacterium]
MEEKQQPNIPEIFLSPYNPNDHEDKLYEMWNDSGYFNPDKCIEDGVTAPDAEPFSIVLPPPNVTGTLHMGHAAMLAIEDILVRYSRMKGKKTLWLPGTDSAAIATQSKVEKNILKSEKKSRHDLGREELLRRVDEFAEESKDTIIGQTKKMGSSLDWSRYAFTLDEKRYKAVMTAFVNMYEDGLIYRGDRIVNWDPKGQTTISDDEIVHEERTGKLYTFKYSKDFPITIATTRPETKVGDTAVAVHPEDERYKEYLGQTFEFEFCDVPVKVEIIGDPEVDPEFGTGAVGVTPAHSKVDWDIADRAGIDRRPQVINEYAKMTVEGRLNNLKVNVAREEVVKWLEAEGLLEKVEDTVQNVGTAERTGGVIEPLPKLQWWIAVNKKFVLKHSEIDGIESGSEVTLKELMVAAVQDGSTDIFPERFKRIYFNWIENLNDWCISRQIWYGHRIPAWYRNDEIKVQIESPGNDWEQESDTLDTWFSSGLWTFSTLGWPEITNDLKTYHPTTVLETGYDIIFFWVARMILMSTYHLGQVPFKNVYLHGLVRDAKGKKMSKSIGNVIDPLDMINQFGADATRLSLIIGAAPGNDMPLSEDKVRGYKKFANKLWNISRFILTSTEDADWAKEPKYSDADKKILETLQNTVKEVSDDIDKFSLYLSAEKAYHYVWHDLADVVLEESKPIISGDDTEAKNARQHVLKECLVTSLKILHPFMPFVTEAVWQNLPKEMKDHEILM